MPFDFTIQFFNSNFTSLFLISEHFLTIRLYFLASVNEMWFLKRRIIINFSNSTLIFIFLNILKIFVFFLILWYRALSKNGILGQFIKPLSYNISNSFIKWSRIFALSLNVLLFSSKTWYCSFTLLWFLEALIFSGESKKIFYRLHI